MFLLSTHTFFEVKIDTNWVNSTPCQTYWVLLTGAKDEHFSCFHSSCQWGLSRQARRKIFKTQKDFSVKKIHIDIVHINFEMFCFRNWILWGQSSFGNFRNSSKEIWGRKYQIARGKYQIDIGTWKFKKSWWNHSRRFRKWVNWQWFSTNMQKLFSNIFDQCHKLVHKYLKYLHKPQWLSL